MFGLGGGELLLLAFIALIFIGPKKLPELAKGLGKGIREFQKAKDDIVSEVVEEKPKVSENPSSTPLNENEQKPHKD